MLNTKGGFRKIQTQLPVLNAQMCKNVSLLSLKKVTYKLLDQEKVFLVDCNAFVEKFFFSNFPLV